MWARESPRWGRGRIVGGESVKLRLVVEELECPHGESAGHLTNLDLVVSSWCKGPERLLIGEMSMSRDSIDVWKEASKDAR